MTGALVYLDSSAIVKLVVPEPESGALFDWLADRPERISSVVARVEVRRALRRARMPSQALRRAAEVMDRIGLVAADRAVLDAAGELNPPELRSLDAIHLATALSVGGDLAGLVTYDDGLGAAAARMRVEVWRPGSD